MAIIEFFKIEISNKKSSNINLNFGDLLNNQLKEKGDIDKYCTRGRCDASMSESINNDTNITFDFIKFTKEIIHSTIISQPSDETDTFQALNDKLINDAEYKKKDIKVVKKIIKNDKLTIKEIKHELENTNLDKFVIYRIIRDENLDKQDNEQTLLEFFYKSNLERLRRFKTYFNIIYYEEKHNILLLQKNKDGFDYRKLEEYINYLLLKESEYSISIEYIYDNDFMNILEKSVLDKFQFTFDLTEKSILDDEEFTNPLHQIFNKLGKNRVTITTDADRNSSLDNKKLMEFFRLATEAGLLDVVKVKKQGSRRLVDSSSKGDILVYSDNNKLESLEDANKLFQIAIDEKIDIVRDKIWY